jgi:hypothetical protein
MMRSLALLLLTLGFSSALAAPAAAADLGHARLLDGGADRELRHAFLPSERNVHGELRLLRRGDAWVLQTLLYTPQLRRGVQRMRRKELYAWPAGAEGWDDSQRYLADLESAKDQALQRFAARSDAADPRQKLMIELVLGERDAFWAFYDVELAPELGSDARGGRAMVRSRTPFLVRDASRSYLRRALAVQAETGFGAAPVELQELPR